MEEINWRVIDNRLKDEMKSPHEAMVLEIERGRKRDRLYKSIVGIKEILPEPTNADTLCSIDRDDLEEKATTTVEGMEKLKR
jgi:hypothetical protein